MELCGMLAVQYSTAQYTTHTQRHAHTREARRRRGTTREKSDGWETTSSCTCQSHAVATTACAATTTTAHASRTDSIAARTQGPRRSAIAIGSRCCDTHLDDSKTSSSTLE